LPHNAAVLDRPFSDFVQALAARTPTPGGGAAGGFAAAMGNALLLMVVRFSRGKKANVARETELAAAERALLALAAPMATLAQRDCDSFAPVAAAYQLPQTTDAEKGARQRAIDLGLEGALGVPLETLRLARAALAAVTPVADCANKTIVSDLAAGAELLIAAAEIALLNVRINCSLLGSGAVAERAASEATALRAQLEVGRQAVRARAEALLGPLLPPRA
jgi:formiminotetrahydrofolate cyclodeaminase